MDGHFVCRGSQEVFETLARSPAGTLRPTKLWTLVSEQLGFFKLERRRLWTKGIHPCYQYWMNRDRAISFLLTSNCTCAAQEPLLGRKRRKMAPYFRPIAQFWKLKLDPFKREDYIPSGVDQIDNAAALFSGNYSVLDWPFETVINVPSSTFPHNTQWTNPCGPGRMSGKWWAAK